MKTLYSISEVTQMINNGEVLLLSGDQKSLMKLPNGKWIGGTIPYFMSEDGGLLTHDKIQVVKLPSFMQNYSVKTYNASELKQIPKDYQPNGFSYIIIPAFSDAHSTFAKECSTYDGIFDRPLVGWISGFDLAELGKTSAKVFNGTNGVFTDAKAIVMHVDLPSDKCAQINIINLFYQGSGDIITFESTGFETVDCNINGQKRNFAEYLLSKKINTQLPLVANYMGAMINISFQAVDADKKKVSFYAPVFPGVEYKVATPVFNYEKEFGEQLDNKNIEPFFSCNCILNYLYAHLEGKKTGHIVGPMTFGEIAYMLLNQTTVYLTIENTQ
jgi:hypothetical protein